MTTAYTSLLGFALPVTGELSGTWGDTVNNGITSLLDSAIAGTTTLSADSDVTLTTTQGSSNTAREAILLWTAGGSATRTITAPAQSKIYTVINASSGTQSIILAGVGPTSGVTIAKGESALCAWNGSDFIKISNTAGPGTFTNLTVTGNTSLGDADTDTITQAASYVTGTQLKSAKTATNTLSLAAYDVDGAAYTNLITLTAGNTPTLTLTSTGVGTINNMSIGATTASTGAFTTLSASGAVTLSGGTENGVAYLNGSKVLTTGSALVFDGSQLGIVSASGNYPGKFTGASGTAGYLYSDGNGFGVTDNGVNNGIYIRPAINSTIFYAGNAEGFRLTSTSLYTASGINVGIGTSSPLAKLNVSGGTTIASLAEWNSKANTVFTLANAAVRLGVGYDANDQPLIQGFDSTNGARPIGLQVYGGNLGIGTSSPTAKLTVSGNQSFVEKTAAYLGVDVATSAGNGGNLTVKAGAGNGAGNTAGTLYLGAGRGNASASNGSIVFGIAQATNTVGLDSTLMTLDASGNLGIGTSSPAARLSVIAASANGTAATIGGIEYGGSKRGLTIKTFNSAGGDDCGVEFNAADGLAGYGAFKFAANTTTLATIDASGNLGLGVTPSAIFTDYKGIQLYNATGMGMYGSGYGATVTSNAYPSATGSVYTRGGNSYRPTKYSAFDGAHTWSYAAAAGTTISWTDAMTLDASGNLLVGTTGTGGLSTGRFRIEAASGADAIRVRHPDASGGTSATMMLFISTADAAVGSITSNGTSTAYNTSSDYRLKNTIAPMTGALVKLAQLKPVTYKWNADGSDGEGFIAHELAEVVPQCVTGEKDAVDANGNPVYQGIDTSFLVATLTAAIKEQQALITQLTARITALESA